MHICFSYEWIISSEVLQHEIERPGTPRFHTDCSDELLHRPVRASTSPMFHCLLLRVAALGRRAVLRRISTQLLSGSPFRFSFLLSTKHRLCHISSESNSSFIAYSCSSILHKAALYEWRCPTDSRWSHELWLSLGHLNLRQEIRETSSGCSIPHNSCRGRLRSGKYGTFSDSVGRVPS